MARARIAPGTKIKLNSTPPQPPAVLFSWHGVVHALSIFIAAAFFLSLLQTNNLFGSRECQATVKGSSRGAAVLE